MPANEQTWRDQKLMHVVFGVSALVMLASTVWMMERDHNREWRRWQLADRGKERWALDAMLAEESNSSRDRLAELASEMSAARSKPINPSMVEQFVELVKQENQRLSEAGTPPSQRVNLASLSDKTQELNQLATEAATARVAVEPAREAAQQALERKLELESGEGEGDEGELRQATEDAEAKREAFQHAHENRQEAERRAADARSDLLGDMDRIIAEAKRREDAVTVAKKFKAADHTAIVSEHGLAVAAGVSQEEIDAIQAKIDQITAEVRDLDAQVATAKDYRVALDSIRREIVEPETAIQKELDGVNGDLNRIETALVKNGRPTILGSETLGRTWEAINRGPVLDALYDGNIRIDQIWLPEITIDYNFSSVARYDRCTTCHRSIDVTAPGSATEPAYPAIPDAERERLVRLATPDSPPRPEVSIEGEETQPSLASVYGFVLAPEGQVDRYDMSIQYVMPESRAAQSGLEMGDVIVAIEDDTRLSHGMVEGYLLNAEWGEPVEMRIRRGLDQPFTSHPRLGLFVGSMSPHKKGEMGCTICHDGQGSATDFKWASHTPNDPDEAVRWSREHGWFDNHHWIFPMTPQRFIESNCLKCHHEVVDLEPSERFPDPPAPKLVKGYHLVRQYGCYGCHEINGYADPQTRIGPDLRTEPNYHEVAAAVLKDGGLSDEQRVWAQRLVERPDDNEVRQQLYRAIKRDEELSNTSDAEQQAQLTKVTHELGGLLKDVDTPGQFRKVGPSLRYLASKVDYKWLYSWIRRPADFRPTTRMPQFFGQHEHLEQVRKEFPNAEGEPDQLTDQEYTARFEAIEIRALAEFLLKNSSDFEYLELPEGVAAASPERGRWLFQSRGCLACHSHVAFPGIASTQGPDLSRVAAKFGLENDNGQRWLYSWLKQPNRYHSRTVMPNLFLDPIVETDANGEPTGEVTDPAADILAFLVSTTTDWQPQDVPEGPLSAEDAAALEQLTAEWLSAVYPRRRATRYASDGIPADQGENIKTDESVLVGMTPENKIEQQLEYVARRSLSRYGCFGCHDIPGFEAAKPIGTGLADWGRKAPDKLAFENITQFLATHGVDGTDNPADHHDDHGDGHHGLDPRKYDDDTGYFLQALNSHQRNGFIWQKLRMPRSYDYEKTRNKRYDERLRMPRFPFSAEEREAVITFVLGLVNEPAKNHLYRPDARDMAIVEGRNVLHKYNCAGCHILDMERWEFAFEPDWFEEPLDVTEFPFLRPDVPSTAIEASLETDRQGMLHAELVGMPVMSDETGAADVVDIDGEPLDPEDDESEPFYEFTLYRNAVVAGFPRPIGGMNLLIPAERGKYGPANGKALSGHGGDLAKYLFPHVIAKEHEQNPAAKGSEAWGWLPPPLVGEGQKVQTDWLHDFLMDPHPIRPAVVLRMPNFHMSSDEARKLVNYFAAKDNAEWPYEYNQRRREGYLASQESSHPKRMDDAMKIVTNVNYCVQCHTLGDFSPKGAVKTQGPQLAEVYQRLRPEWVRKWIANPLRTIPYTGMPVNIPYAPDPPNFGGVSQELYQGTSFEQLDGVVDLLMNFDEYAKRQTTIKSMVQEAPTAEEQAAEAGQPRSDQAAAAR